MHMELDTPIVEGVKHHHNTRDDEDLDDNGQLSSSKPILNTDVLSYIARLSSCTRWFIKNKKYYDFPKRFQLRERPYYVETSHDMNPYPTRSGTYIQIYTIWEYFQYSLEYDHIEYMKSQFSTDELVVKRNAIPLYVAIERTRLLKFWLIIQINYDCS